MNLKEHITYFATPGAEDSPFASFIMSENLMPACDLVAISIGPSSVAYLPVLDDIPPIYNWNKVIFDVWWNQPIVCDKQRRKMSRKDLVLALANKDGGAHVDPELDEIYASLSRQNSLGWEWVSEEGTRDPDSGPELACLRQISHELEKSLRAATDVEPTRGR
ncbi:MAG: hypothetical protein A49_11680 [Methyloceanibacter sp.]|nr:MAG: hypothetical protein A49_11680 [Methyloceanibacter sp.]